MNTYIKPFLALWVALGISAQVAAQPVHHEFAMTASVPAASAARVPGQPAAGPAGRSEAGRYESALSRNLAVSDTDAESKHHGASGAVPDGSAFGRRFSSTMSKLRRKQQRDAEAKRQRENERWDACVNRCAQYQFQNERATRSLHDVTRDCQRMANFTDCQGMANLTH